MARLELDIDPADGQASFSYTGEVLFDMGLRFSAGRDVEIDLIAAHKWFNLATLKGHEGAKAYRTEIASELTRPEIAKAQRMARGWLRAA